MTLTILFCWILGDRRPHATDLAVFFTGFTNASTGNFAAIYCLPNGTRRTLAFDVVALEAQSNTNWIPVKVDFPSHFGCGVVASSQSVVREVDVPSTNAVYRLRVAGIERRTGLPGFRDRIEILYDRLITVPLLRRKGVGDKFLGRRYEVTSGRDTK